MTMDAEKVKELNLRRSANTTAIMIKAKRLEVGEEQTFRILDANVWQRVRTRLTRLGQDENRSYFTKLEGNKITVRRGA